VSEDYVRNKGKEGTDEEIEWQIRRWMRSRIGRVPSNGK
jgi:hypothetical protein